MGEDVGKSSWSAGKGFTLIELLLALFLSLVVGGAIAGSFHQCQQLARDLHEMADRNQNLMLVPLFVSRWVSAAGNGIVEGGGLSLKEGNSSLEWRQDIDGERGFPNGRLTEAYEHCRLRFNGDAVQLWSGSGSYQSVVRRICRGKVSRAGPMLLGARIEAETGPLRLSGRKALLSCEVRVHLWNFRPHLFAREDR